MEHDGETLPKIFTLLDVLSVQVGGIQSDVSVLKSDVAVLKSDVSALKTDVAAIRADLGAHRTETRSEFVRVDARIDDLTKEFRGFRASAG